MRLGILRVVWHDFYVMHGHNTRQGGQTADETPEIRVIPHDLYLNGELGIEILDALRPRLEQLEFKPAGKAGLLDNYGE